MLNNENKGLLYGFIAVLGFGLTLPISKELLQYFNPYFIAFGRVYIAGLFAIVFLLIWSSNLPTLKQFMHLMIIALGVVIGFPLFSTISMQSLPASHGAIIVGILPLSTTLMSVFFTKERPSLFFWLFALIGSGLVVTFTLIEGKGSLQEGDFFLLISILMASIGYTLGAKLAREINGWEVISWTLVISLPILIIPTIWYMPQDINAIPYSGYIYFLYLGLVSQLFAFFAWYKGLSLGGIARVSQVQLIQTSVTLYASSVLLEEKISMVMIIFTVLIIFTVWISKHMSIHYIERTNNEK